MPETKKIDDLLKELQVHRVQIAIIIDEYSSFVGIVTVEDILEEIVGEIRDEYDKEEPGVQNIAEGVYVLDAQMWVDDINDELGIGLPLDESYETVGGLLIDRLGHIPQHPGEKVEIEAGRITLVVMQMHGRRIVKIKCIARPTTPGRGRTPVMEEPSWSAGIMTKRIVVVASGRGSNFQAIIEALQRGSIPAVCVALVTDNPKAYAIERAEAAGIPVVVVDYARFATRELYEGALLDALRKARPDLVALAGYMRILGSAIVREYAGMMINIHPVLLPVSPVSTPSGRRSFMG